MMNKEAEGILFSDGQSSIRLRRAGRNDVTGYPTWLDIKAGPFSGTLQITVDDWVYKHFSQQLALLNDRLSGSAQMGNPHDNIYMTFVGNGLGGIKVNIEVTSYSPPVKLIFELEIDQTYLPAIIAGIDEEFGDSAFY
jgi:hypothetical protein